MSVSKRNPSGDLDLVKEVEGRGVALLDREDDLI